MAFLDFIFGRPSKRVERNLYDPNQTNFLNNISGQIQNILPMGLNNLQGLLGGDEDYYQQYTQPIINDLYQRVLPQTAETFTGTYGPGSFRSSAFGQEVGGQLANLGQNLASARFDLQQRGLQGIGQLLNLTQIPLQPRRGFYIRPRRPGLIDYAAGGLTRWLGGK